MSIKHLKTENIFQELFEKKKRHKLSKIFFQTKTQSHSLQSPLGAHKSSNSWQFEAFSLPLFFFTPTACDKNSDRIETLLNDIFFYNNETLSYENVSKENAMQVISNLIKTSSAHRRVVMDFYLNNFEVVNEK